MSEATPVEMVIAVIPEDGVPRPERQAPPPGPLADQEERDVLVAAYTAEWNRQVEWRMHIRRSAARMLEGAGGSPCHSGTNSWIRSLGVPPLDEDRNGYMLVGDEARALSRARLALASSDPATLTTMPTARIPQRLEALRRTGESWRGTFLSSLDKARQGYPNITRNMVIQLTALLVAPVPTRDEGAAPFPVSIPVVSAPPAPGPAPAHPQTVRMTVAIILPLELTGVNATYDDVTLQNNVTEQLRNTLRASVSRKPDVTLGGGITIVPALDRR